MVISCDKEMDSDINSIAVPSQEIAKEDALSLLIEGIINANLPESKSGNTSTKKSSGDYVYLTLFSSGGRNFFSFVDESNDDLCFTGLTISSEGSYDNKNGDGSVLAVELPDGTISREISGNFAGLFSASNNLIMEYDASFNIIGFAVIGADNSATFN